MDEMTCKELVDFLMAYLDRELPEDQRRVFEEHLELCPPCKDYLDSYQECVRLGRAVCGEEERSAEPVPEALVSAILASRSRQ